MSSGLYGLGRWCYRRKGWVLLAWLMLLALLGGLAGLFGGDFDDSFRLPGTQSQDALNQLSMTFPQVAGTSATMVVVAPAGHAVDEPVVRAQVDRSVAELADLDFVDTAASPFDDGPVAGLISQDRRAAIVSLQLPGEASTFPESDRQRLLDAATTLRQRLSADLPGSRVELGGEVFGANVPALSAVEAIGVGIALVVLLVTLGSLMAAAMPLITAIIGVAISMTLIVLATAVATVNSTTPMLAVMLGLAVGIDYALFILSRHREQLSAGMAAEESAAQATATSGSAVVFAGLTVIIALVGLVVARIPFLTAMGLAAAAAVGIAVLIALTALPAFMGLAGERMRPRSKPNRNGEGASAEQPSPFFTAWVRAVTRVPLLTVALVVIGLGALAVPAKDLQLALPDAGQNPVGTPSRETYDLLAEHFGPGFNGPLIVTAGIVGSNDPLGVMAGLKRDLEAMPGVASVPLSTPNQNADTGIVQVIPTTGPQDARTTELVERIREQAPRWKDEYGVDTAVTGFTAVAIDVSNRLAGALVPFGVFVVGLSLLLLAMVFRSVAVPIKAALGYLLSVLGAFGATAIVFQYGIGAELVNLHTTGPVISFLPIILMGILFGLAMDYEVFLVSRMREHHVHGEDAQTAIRTGFVGSGRVVLAAALIMFSVFAFFVPHGSPEMKSIAFGLAVGVMIDAFIVRMTLVPAVLALLGERAWWLPRWMAHRLPSFDVEGESMQHLLAMADWPAPDDPHIVYADNITIRARGQAVVQRVDVRVLPGQVAVIEGAPAARRALLLALSGRLRADEGQARVAGYLLPDQAARLRRHCEVVDLADPDGWPALAGLLATAVTEVPLVLIDNADAAPSGRAREELAVTIADAPLSGRAVLVAVSARDAIADLLPDDTPVLTLHPAQTRELAGDLR